jgi:hypothetical protein
VQKIIEQHGGELLLDDAPAAPGRTHGARITLTLPPMSADIATHSAASHFPPDGTGSTAHTL